MLTTSDSLLPGAMLADPLYVEVKKRITRSLMAGEWREGAPLPSEARLARHYAVSVGTVRKAIGELVAEKVLVRQPGRGTFVANRNRDYMLDAFFHIVDAHGEKEFPASELVSFRRLVPDAATASRLRLSRGAQVFQIENLLRIGGRPVIFDRIGVPHSVFPDLDVEDFRHRDQTIFGLYQTRYGVTVTRLEEWIRGANADAKTAGLLRVRRGEALLRIERVAYTYDGTPVEYRGRYVNTREHAYLNVLGMKKTSHP